MLPGGFVKCLLCDREYPESEFPVKTRRDYPYGSRVTRMLICRMCLEVIGDYLGAHTHEDRE